MNHPLHSMKSITRESEILERNASCSIHSNQKIFINVSMMTNIHWTIKNFIVIDRKGGESKYIIFLNESFKTYEGQ